DLSVSELRGTVAAVYTETCGDEPTPGADAAGSPDAGAADAGVSFDQMKQDLIAALSVPDDSCHLTAGIGAKADPFPSIAQYRDRWNAMVRGNEFGQQAFTQAEFTQITNVLDAEFQNFRYHGTATAGTVVHDNPTVRLVLVERHLLTEASAQSSFVCFVQSDIDQAVQIFSDPQVFAALVNQPAQIEAEISAVETQYDVGLVNESFGASSREALEALQVTSNCPTPIDLSAYFAILDRVELAHAATIQGPAVLTVQAAGNDGAQIDSGADSLSCDIGDPLSLLVGSYNPGNQVRNTFSDFGACVDVYAPGQSIVAPYAGDWLLWVAGTSFSSPMVARYVSLNAPAPFAPAQARTDLLALRGADGSLPVALFPSDSFYAPDEATTAALIAVPPPRRASTRPPSRVDLHRVLHPLSLLRALRRR
ncbi:MAG TPA: S8/S53 family peptidase, partial [Polyangia bacterium]